MTTIDQLIRLNVELEGALRVLQARPSDEALAAAQEKYAEFSRLFGGLPGIAGDTPETPTEVKDDEAEGSEEAPAEEPDGTDVPADAIVVEDDSAAQRAARAEGTRDIRRNLTLNDKFMFRRELFGGSAEEFNDTLDLISAMSSYAEAREYLCDDLAWDPENPTVKEFLNLVTNYFNAKS